MAAHNSVKAISKCRQVPGATVQSIIRKYLKSFCGKSQRTWQEVQGDTGQADGARGEKESADQY